MVDVVCMSLILAASVVFIIALWRPRKCPKCAIKLVSNREIGELGGMILSNTRWIESCPKCGYTEHHTE